MKAKCPVCQTEAERSGEDLGRQLYVKCKVCGPFKLTGSAEVELKSRIASDPELAPLISHGIRNMARQGSHPQLTTAALRRIVEHTELPDVPTQAENFILWLGKYLDSPEGIVGVYREACAAIIGAPNADTVGYHARQLKAGGYVSLREASKAITVGLTYEGWRRYDDLHRRGSSSRVAFMAMPFQNDLLERVYNDCFRPAVKRAGFALRRIDDKPPAGSIDDRLRVEIRRCRFLIAELTSDNSGAYWEAGYAEGLGRPVIYTCQKSYFDESGTHFDASHFHTVIWEENELDDAGHRMTATIRATLPSEANLSDDDDVI